jgi:hypothetical protein
MKLRVSVLALFIAAAGTFGCGSPTRWSVDTQVSVGQQSCAVLAVPTDWELPLKHRDWLLAISISRFDRYELRRSKHNQTLYIRMYFNSRGGLPFGTENFYSENKFAFEPGSNSPMAGASEEQWQAAIPLQFTHEFLASDIKGEVIYRRKVFPKKSSQASAMPSNTYKWATVFSSADFSVSDPVPRENTGLLYFEIFDLASGQRIVSGEAKFSTAKHHRGAE